MHKIKLTWLLLILLVLSSACSVARGHQMQEVQEAILPVRPILDVQVQENGGICLDKEDTKELLLYIMQLERVRALR